MPVTPVAFGLFKGRNIDPALWRRVTVLLVITVLVALRAGAASTTTVAQKPQAVPAAPAPAGQVVAIGALAARNSRKGGQLRFWITISNQTPQSICAVTLIIPEAPGYGSATLQTPAGGTIEAPECPKPASPPPNFLIAAGLRSGQSATVQGNLPAVESQDDQTLEGLVSWTIPAGVPSQIAVALGQNSIDSGWGRFWSGAYEVVKDFALPVLLLGITVGVGLWDKKKETARKAADENRTWQAETWKQMLPVSHRLAVKHYTRIGGSVRDALDFIELCLEEQDPAKREPFEREAFYNLLLLGRQLEELGDGLFFKDRVGERLAARCWGEYLEQFYGLNSATGRINYQQSIKACSPNGDGKVLFMEKLRAQPAGAAPPLTKCIWASWQFFKNRYQQPEGRPAVLLLGAFVAVLEFEMNRPYEHWYGRPEKLVLRKDDAKHIDVETMLLQVAGKIKEDEGDDSRFDVQAKCYIKDGKAGKSDSEREAPLGSGKKKRGFTFS